MTPPNVVFDFDTIDIAFEFANADDRSNEAYLDRHTGQSLFFSSSGDSDEEPDDFDDTTRYVAIPDTRDFGMSSQLAIRFATEVVPSLLEDVRDAFRRRGGFRRLRELVEQNDLLYSWYAYEAEHERAIIIQWCADNDIHFTMNRSSAE